MKYFKQFAVIVAGGRGTRMSSDIKKQYIKIDGIPILNRTVAIFATLEEISQIILVIPHADKQYCKKHILNSFESFKPITLISGGSSRQESVYNGLLHVKELASKEDALVFIHDAVRPFVSKELIRLCGKIGSEKGACIPILEIVDTVKQVGSDGRILKTRDRSCFYRAQTPQVFKLDLIIRAFEYARKSGFNGTDDASIAEYFGINVYTIQGDPANIKLTNRDDLALAKYIFEQKTNIK